jgi:hypothetical protein
MINKKFAIIGVIIFIIIILISVYVYKNRKTDSFIQIVPNSTVQLDNIKKYYVKFIYNTAPISATLDTINYVQPSVVTEVPGVPASNNLDCSNIDNLCLRNASDLFIIDKLSYTSKVKNANITPKTITINIKSGTNITKYDLKSTIKLAKGDELIITDIKDFYMCRILLKTSNKDESNIAFYCLKNGQYAYNGISKVKVNYIVIDLYQDNI